MISGDSKSCVVHPHYNVQEHAGAHTHLHMFTQYVHPCTEHTKKRDFVKPNGGRSLENQSTV